MIPLRLKRRRPRHAMVLRKAPVAVAVMLSVGLAIAGCLSPDDRQGAGGAAAQDRHLREAEGRTEHPVTIETAFGDVAIDRRPERVAAVDRSGVGVDLVVSLGVTPVVANAPQYAVEQAVRGAIERTITGSKVLDEIENIADTDPGIIITIGEVDEYYSQLSDIAPVLVVDADIKLDQAWAPQLESIDVALDLQGAVEGVKENSRQALAEFRDRPPQLQSMKVFYLVHAQDGLLLYPVTRTRTTDTFLEQLEFDPNTVDPGLLENNFLSLENLRLANADFIILTNHGAVREAALG